jgi:hypothetical protein
VMRQAIQGGARQKFVAEHLGPLFESAVAGDDERAAFVAFATAPNKIRYWMTLTYNASGSPLRTTPCTTNR